MHNAHVSLFSDTLIALMGMHQLSQADLADRTGISQSTISRIIAGRDPMPDQVGAMCAAISTEKSQRIELLLSWLRDCAVVGRVAGIDAAQLVFHTDSASVSAGTIAAELDLLASEAEVDEDLRALLVDLARMVRSHRARENDASGGKLYSFRPENEPSVAEPTPHAKGRRPRATPPIPKPPSAG